MRDPTQPLEDQKALGRAIETLRDRKKNLSPELLAKRAEIDPRRVERIEAGEGDADWNTVVFLVRAIGVGMSEFTKLHDEFVEEEKQAEV